MLKVSGGGFVGVVEGMKSKSLEFENGLWGVLRVDNIEL